MTIAERHAHILEILEKQGFVRVADLATELEVSLVTIRKDLRTLESRQLLFRDHGSASLRQANTRDRPVNEKELIHAEEKRQIAKGAVDLLEPDDVIMIGSGTTVQAFAEAIPSDMALTVITNAMNVAAALLDHAHIELIQLGGIVRKGASAVVGPYARDMLAHFACKTLFLGVDGLKPSVGISTSHLLEAHLNRQMIEAAQQTVVLADASKFGLSGKGVIAPLDRIDLIITDQAASKLMIEEIEAIGPQVILAER